MYINIRIHYFSINLGQRHAYSMKRIKFPPLSQRGRKGQYRKNKTKESNAIT